MEYITNVSETGKKILENISRAIINMTDDEKQSFLIFSEGMACKADLDRVKREKRSA